MLVGDVPNPLRSIAHRELLFRAAPTAIPGFQIDAFAELLGRFNRACVSGRIGIADGIAFLSHFAWVNTHPNLASRGWAGCPSVLPGRPRVSFLTTGTAVPSICTYRIGIGSPTITGRSNCMARWISSCWRAARSSPIASALRSTALVLTSRSARTLICSRPWSNGAAAPTTATCGARRARPPCPPHPALHRQGTVPDDNASTGNRDVLSAPNPAL